MNVSCPECRSVFRVDPAKIPTAGVRARCSVCGGVISVGGGPPIDVEFAPVTAGVAPAPASPPAPALPQPVETAAPAPIVAEAIAPVPAKTEITAPVAPIAPIATTSDPVVHPIQPVQPATVYPNPTRPLTPVRPIAPVQQAPAAFRAAPFVPPSTARAPAQTGPVQPLRPSAFAPRPLQPPVTPTARPSVALRPPGAFPPATPAGSSPSALAGAPRQTAPVSRPGLEQQSTPAVSTIATGTPTSVPQVPDAIKRTPINPFLSNDPNVKARRLARALISDLVTYFPQKREEGLRNGTMKELFREEIKKSYEEYVEQVGREFADSTQHFKEAVNDILCGGQKIF